MYQRKNRHFSVNRSTRKTKMLLLSFFVLLILSITVFVIIKNLKTKEATANSGSEQNQNEVATVSTSETESTAKTVCIDPGHGGNDIGANYKDVSESEVNLKVALELKSILQKEGYKVLMTREIDEYVQKRDRAYYCNQNSADIMVAIHHNAYEDDSSVDYGTMLYYKDSDVSLATYLLNSVSSGLDVKSQGISKFDDSQLWIATMPSVLTESFFITSDYEYRLMNKSSLSRLSDEAKAIATGIDNYFNRTDDGSATAVDSLVIDRTD